MNKQIVNINADLGEGAGQDDQIMPYLSSCNIACGGHTGDEKSVKTTIQLAQSHQVKIGAHPAYPDREHFGRKRPKIDRVALEDSIMEQLTLFFQVAREQGAEVHHIKAHGALYNDAASDEETAALFLNAIRRLGIQCKIYAPFDSVLHRVAEPTFEVIYEAFIDRMYNEDLSLLSRSDEKALHQDPETAWKQLYELYFLEEVTTITGKKAAIKANTFCIHGDHPEAVNMLQYIREKLTETPLRQ
ncbi:MAG: 5-oxoprolinase subunit PxpA [Bacteroidota bacterium]